MMLGQVHAEIFFPREQMDHSKAAFAGILKFIAAPVIAIVLLIWAIWVLVAKFKGFSAADIFHQMSLVHFSQIITAIGITTLNYAVMTGYDYFGMRYAAVRLPFRKIALAAIVGDALNTNLGLNILVGSTIKLRLYSSWGVRVLSIIKAIGMYTIGGYWNGFLFLTGLALIWASPRILPSLLPLTAWRYIGAAFMLIIVLWLINAVINKKSLKFGKHSLNMPGISIAFPLFVISCCDWALAASVFYTLLPRELGIDWHHLLAVFLLAHFLGMLSQAPGGIAVFESTVLILVGNLTSVPSLSASLVLFRVIFYFLPLVVATSLFLVFEIMMTRRILKNKMQMTKRDLSGTGY